MERLETERETYRGAMFCHPLLVFSPPFLLLVFLLRFYFPHSPFLLFSLFRFLLFLSYLFISSSSLLYLPLHALPFSHSPFPFPMHFLLSLSLLFYVLIPQFHPPPSLSLLPVPTFNETCVRPSITIRLASLAYEANIRSNS